MRSWRSRGRLTLPMFAGGSQQSRTSQLAGESPRVSGSKPSRVVRKQAGWPFFAGVFPGRENQGSGSRREKQRSVQHGRKGSSRDMSGFSGKGLRFAPRRGFPIGIAQCSATVRSPAANFLDLPLICTRKEDDDPSDRPKQVMQVQSYKYHPPPSRDSIPTHVKSAHSRRVVGENCLRISILL